MADGKNGPEVTAGKFSTEGTARLEQIAIETAELEKQIKEAKLLAMQQELADLTERNADAKQKREINRQRQLNAAVRDRQRREREDRIKAMCNHTQGGDGLQGLYEGDGTHTTYQKETDSVGQESFRCIRCNNRIRQYDNAEEFKLIKRLPHKGLVGPVPVTFKFVDDAGNQVSVGAVIIPE